MTKFVSASTKTLYDCNILRIELSCNDKPIINNNKLKISIGILYEF